MKTVELPTSIPVNHDDKKSRTAGTPITPSDERPGDDDTSRAFCFSRLQQRPPATVAGENMENPLHGKAVTLSRADLSSGTQVGSRHAKRTERKHIVPKVKITPRDKRILQALAEMKFLRTAQIGHLCFGRLTSTVRLRLRRLLDAGLVKTWVTTLNEENLYSLGRRGLAVLENSDEGRDSIARAPRRLERRLEHLLSINEFRISLQARVSGHGGALTWWQSEWQMKRLGRQDLIPDALFRLHLSQREMALALEMDLGGEPVENVFASKLRRYVALRVRHGFSLDWLLVVTSTTRRLAALLEAAAREPGAANFLFTIKDTVSLETILGDIWTSPRLVARDGGPGFISILDLFAGEQQENHCG